MDYLVGRTGEWVIRNLGGKNYHIPSPEGDRLLAGLGNEFGKSQEFFSRSNFIDLGIPRDKNLSQRREVFVCSHPICPAFLNLIHTPPDVPDPTTHWCLQVGDYYYQLNPTHLEATQSGVDIMWACEDHHVGDGVPWLQKKLAGHTTFNDQAIYDAGEEAMATLPKAYNIVTNNCQHLVNKMLSIISPDASPLPTFELLYPQLEDGLGKPFAYGPTYLPNGDLLPNGVPFVVESDAAIAERRLRFHKDIMRAQLLRSHGHLTATQRQRMQRLIDRDVARMYA